MTTARALDSELAGCTIIVAADRRTVGVAAALERRGAVVHRTSALSIATESDIAVHRWEPPVDPEAVRRSTVQAAAGEADAVLFASAAGAASWIVAADESGSLERIRLRAESGRLLLACVGPLTAAPLHDANLRATVAERGRPGSLARTVIAHFSGGNAPSLPTDAGLVEVRSGGVLVDGVFIPLSRSASALIEALASAGGRVLSRAELGGVLPGAERNGHAVEVAVARLRAALGGNELVHTVVKRGYRLAVTDY